MRAQTFALSFLLVGIVGVSAAQSQQEPQTEQSDDARARALFGEGVAHAEEGRFEAAAESFRAALTLRSAPAIQYNLARALVELDQSDEAYRLAASAAVDSSATEELRRDAETLMAQLRSSMAVLRVSLGGQADGVRIDDRVLAPDEIDAPLVMAAGEHRIVGLRGGEEVSHRTIALRAGVETVVDVSVVETPREAAISATEEDAGVERSRTGLVVGVVGAVVAVAIVIVVIAVVAGGGTQSPVEGDFEPGVIRW